MKKIIILISIIFLCTGCYDYSEINNIAILNGIGIDYKDNEYEVTYEIINTEKQGTSEENTSKSYTISNKASSIEEAIQKNNDSIPKKITFENIQVMIISEEIANMGLTNIADYFLRDNHLTTNFYLVLSRDSTPKEILNYEGQVKSINSETIMKLLSNSTSNITFTIKDQFDYLIAEIKDNLIDIIIPCVNINNELNINSLAVFKGDKLNYYLREDELNYYSILNKKGENNNILIKSDLGSIIIYKSDFNINFINNQYIINLNIDGKLESLNENINIKDSNNIDKLESYYHDYINNNLKKYIDKTFFYNSDILGLSKILYIKNDQNYLNWQHPYTLNINLQLNRVGGLFEVIK